MQNHLASPTLFAIARKHAGTIPGTVPAPQ